MFAGCMVVQSSARPCVLPGPSGAARRSPHHPWGQEPCCADPPVCPGPVGRTIIVWHYVIFLNYIYLLNCISCAQTVLLKASTHHLHRSIYSMLTCVVRIISYSSSLGAGAGVGSGAGFLTKESCFMLPLILLAFDFCKGDFWNRALWSSSRRAWAVATSSKNSSLCSDVTDEKMTAETQFREWSELGIYQQDNF